MGVEALVRWNHPEKGLISPGEFIPIFEKNGFITKLDYYVWEAVCKDMKSWAEKGNKPLSVSVNVSRADIYNPKLVDLILSLINKYNIPIDLFHLEITETAYTDTPKQIVATVKKLKKIGFIIEMDDFGSGYSSLNMLAELPVDVLKLDMGFIQNETKKKSGKGILNFVISLAKWLDLAVVAEGVETIDQIKTLRMMECNYVQGFYYAKPMKKKDLENLLADVHVGDMSCTSSIGKSMFQHVPKRTEMNNGREMLIVDDVELNRIILSSAFSDSYQTVEAENGDEAWKYLDENYEKIDVVMLDLLMPVMDGFQLLEKIRKDERMRELPVVITSQGTEDSERRALSMEANDFIAKPYNQDIIRHRVFNVIANYQLNQLKKRNIKFWENNKEIKDILSKEVEAKTIVEMLSSYFDIVRLVDPKETMVYGSKHNDCDFPGCFTIWKKSTRCENCISLRALKEKARCNKIEYADKKLYFVIAQYVPYQEKGAVVEIVIKVDNFYVDDIADADEMFSEVNFFNNALETDQLTGVKNRRYLDNNIDKYLTGNKENQKNIGVAMVDVDDLKMVNDTCGHLAGDEAIKSIAASLKSNIEFGKDDVIIRYGGDEFLAICENIEPKIFLNRMKKMVKATEANIDVLEGNYKIGISAGCVNLVEKPDATIEELIDIADKRLYAAKDAGKGCLVNEDQVKKD